MKVKSISGWGILIASLAITLLLVLFSVVSYIFIPEFIESLKGLNVEPPLITKLIIHTYQYWVVLPVTALILSIYVGKTIGSTGEIILKKNLYCLAMLIVLLLFAIALFVITIEGMYAPIFALEN